MTPPAPSHPAELPVPGPGSPGLSASEIGVVGCNCPWEHFKMLGWEKRCLIGKHRVGVTRREPRVWRAAVSERARGCGRPRWPGLRLVGAGPKGRWRRAVLTHSFPKRLYVTAIVMKCL